MCFEQTFSSQFEHVFNKEELFKTIEHALQVLIQFKHKLLLLLFVIKILFEILHFLH